MGIREQIESAVAGIEQELEQSPAAKRGAPPAGAGRILRGLEKLVRDCYAALRSDPAGYSAAVRTSHRIADRFGVFVSVDPARTIGSVHFVFHGRHFGPEAFSVDLSGPVPYRQAEAWALDLEKRIERDAGYFTAATGRRLLSGETR